MRALRFRGAAPFPHAGKAGRRAPPILGLSVAALIASFAMSATAADVPSDARLKRDVERVSPARGLDVVMALQPVTFWWSEQQVAFPQGGEQIGLIAQEVVEVLPEVVEDRGGYLYVGYDQITALLVAATQRQQALLVEQAALIEDQQLEIDELRARLDALEGEL